MSCGLFIYYYNLFFLKFWEHSIGCLPEVRGVCVPLFALLAKRLWFTAHFTFIQQFIQGTKELSDMLSVLSVKLLHAQAHGQLSSTSGLRNFFFRQCNFKILHWHDWETKQNWSFGACAFSSCINDKFVNYKECLHARVL